MWYFWHRHVGVKCSGHDGKYYSCEVTQENSCHDVDPSFKIPRKKTDKQVFEEYIKNFFVRSNMHLIASNKLAFPNAKPHARMIHCLIRQRRLEELENFLNENHCLVDSITTCDALFAEDLNST